MKEQYKIQREGGGWEGKKTGRSREDWNRERQEKRYRVIE